MKSACALAAALAVLAMPDPTVAASWSVTSTIDPPDPAWPGSLRYAFERAATASTTTWIDLTPVAGQTIVLTRALPIIDQPVTTSALYVTGAAATIDGSAVPLGDGLAVASAGWLRVDGISIEHFPDNGIMFGGTVTGALLTAVSSNLNGGSGLKLSGPGVRNVVVDGNGVATLNGNGDDGLTLLNQTAGHLITDVVIDGNVTNGVLAGDRVNGVQIAGCTIQNNIQTGAHLTNGATGVQFGPANTVRTNALGGIIIEGASTTLIAITDNTVIDNNLADGIRLIDVGNGIQIIGNASIASNSGHGIALDVGGSNILIAGNGAIQSNGGTGIRVNGPLSGVQIHGNTIDFNGSGRGIELLGGVRDTWIGRTGQGNVIRNHTDCILLNGASATRMAANTLSGCQTAVSLSSSDGLYLLGGDTLSGNAVGIAASTGSDLSVTSATFSGHTDTAIKVGSGFSGDVRIGPGTTLSASSSIPQITLLGGSSVVVTDSTLDGGNIATAGIDSDLSASGALLVYNSEILRHTGAGIDHTGDAPLTVAASAIHDNRTGVVAAQSSAVQMSDNGDTSCSNSDGLYANGDNGIELFGSTATLRGNCIRDNGRHGVYATLYDGGGAGNLSTAGDILSHITVENNGFARNGTGSVLVLESYIDNAGDILSGADGNDFVEPGGSPTQFSLSHRWYGLIEIVTSDQALYTGSAICQWPGVPTGAPVTTPASGGYCPDSADPLDFRTWREVETFGVATDGSRVVHFAPGSEEPVVVASGASTASGQYVWDGCLDAATDLSAATTPYNQADGSPAVCGGNPGARFQAARITYFPAPEVRFMNSAYDRDIESVFIGSGSTPELYIEANAREINQTPGIDSVTADVENLDSGDREIVTLVEVTASSPFARLAAPLPVLARDDSAGSPTIGDGSIECGPRETIRVTFINQGDPSRPVTTDTVTCQEQTASRAFFCDAAGNEQPNNVIGAPLHVCVEDPDQNTDAALPDVLPVSSVVVEAQAFDVQDFRYETYDALVTGGSETGPSTDLFSATITNLADDNLVPASSADTVLSCRPGDRLKMTYTDPDNGTTSSFDRAEALGRCVLPAAASGLQVRIPIASFALRQRNQASKIPDAELSGSIASVAPDQWFVVEVNDPNRNYHSTAGGVDQIAAGDFSAALNELDAIQRARITVESFDASGNRIDWMPLTLIETGDATATFRAFVRTSSHFGANPDFLSPNDVLFVVPDGSIRFSYTDEDDPAYRDDLPGILGLNEPCPAGFTTWDCSATTIPVVESASDDEIALGDRYGHRSPQLWIREDENFFNRFGVILARATANASPQTVDTFTGFGRIDIEDLTSFDGTSVGVGQETAPDSGVFLFETGYGWLGPGEVADPLDAFIDARYGDVLSVVYRDPAQPSDPAYWTFDTAVLCRNAPSFIEITRPTAPDDTVDRVRPDDRLTLRLFDIDQNADPDAREVVTVRISSLLQQDLEAITLVETDVDTGIFERTVFFPGSGDAAPGDGDVRVDDGDTVSIRYADDSVEVETSPYCETQDEWTVVLAAESPDRLTRLEFIDDQGRVLDRLPPGAPVRLRLYDVDANRDTNAPDRATATVFLDPERDGRVESNQIVSTADLVETGNRTAIFEGGAATPGIAAAPSLADLGPVLGSWIVARYLDDPSRPDDDLIATIPILGEPLQVTMTTHPESGSVGDAVVVTVDIFNPNELATLPADLLVNNFADLGIARGSLQVDGARVSIPEGRPWRLPVGQIAAKRRVRVRWTAAVSPGAAPKQAAWAEVWAGDTLLSNRGTATFRVVEEPLFARSTVLIHTWQDRNGNGLQEFTEPPLPSVRIVAADGLSVRTDRNGQAHFAHLTPGPTAFRIDPQSLPPGWEPVGRDRAFVELLPGMVHSIGFGVSAATEVVVAKARAVPWREVHIEPVAASVPVSGSLPQRRIYVAGRAYPMLEADLEIDGLRDGALYLDELRQRGGLTLRPRLSGDEQIRRWTLWLYEQGTTVPVRRFRASGAPPAELRLDTATALELIRPGRDYFWRLEVVGTSGVARSTDIAFHAYLEPPREEVGVAARFERGEASLDPYTILALREAAQLLQNYPEARVLIEGFTDNTGTPEANRRLSERRAAMARDYLVIVEGIDPDRIDIAGRGATRFVAPNDTEEGRAMNRRVEISVFGLPSRQARVFKPTVRGPGGAELRIGREGRFRTTGRVSGDRLAMAVQFPSGATYVATITLPETRVWWPEGGVALPPDFTIPLTLTAPTGTTVTGLPVPVRIGHGDTVTVPVDLAGRAALRLTFHPPDAPAISWVALVRLRGTRKPPPGLVRLNPDRFLRLELPRTDRPLRTGPWTIRGEAAPGTRIDINGRRTVVDHSGSFTTAVQIRPDTLSTFQLEVSAVHPAGAYTRIERQWPVEEQQILAVGLIEASADWTRRNDYLDGTVSDNWTFRTQSRFYAEGTLRGDVLLRARLRTSNQKLSEALPALLDYDGPAADLIDPSRSYVVYGDGSTAVDEAPGAGPLFLSLKWRGQALQIGTIELDQGDSLEPLQQSRYGAHVGLSSAPLAGTDNATLLDAWGTRDNAAAALDRIAATGGQLYFLRHTDLQEGSDRIWIEVEDPITGLRRVERQLQPGRDYAIDYRAGRVWLNTPIGLGTARDTIIRDGALGSTQRWIVASYQYRPGALVAAGGFGQSLRQQLAGRGELGIAYQQQDVDSETDQLGRVWLDLTPHEQTHLRFEAGRRWSAAGVASESLDGGLSWSTGGADGGAANAFAASASQRLGPVDLRLDGYRADDGYGGRYAADTTIAGGTIALSWQVTNDVSLHWRGDAARLGPRYTGEDRIGLNHRAGPLRLGWEFRHAADVLSGQQDHRVDGAVRATWPLTPKLTVYGEHQQGLYDSASTGALQRRSTLGAAYAINATWNTWLEGTEGNRERGGQIGFGWRRDGYSLTTGYGVTQNLLDGTVGGVASAGAQQQIGPRLRLHAGEEIRHGRRTRGAATLAGLDWLVRSGIQAGLSGERGRFTYDRGQNHWIRSGIHTRLLGRTGRHRFAARTSWARDDGRNDRIEWTTDDSWNIRVGTSTELQAGVRFARQTSAVSRDPLAEYHEWAIGAAWRPVNHNRIQLLHVLRWARELLTPEQDPGRTLMVGLISSTDLVLQVLRDLEFGAKLAVKRSGVGLEGFRSHAIHTLLGVGRAAWIFWRPGEHLAFDLWGEYRTWVQVETEQLRHGPLVELGVRGTDYLRFGIAWNFTQFDDNLRPHDRFESGGIRLRLTAGLF